MKQLKAPMTTVSQKRLPFALGSSLSTRRPAQTSDSHRDTRDGNSEAILATQFTLSNNTNLIHRNPAKVNALFYCTEVSCHLNQFFFFKICYITRVTSLIPPYTYTYYSFIGKIQLKLRTHICFIFFGFVRRLSPIRKG